MMSIGDRVVYKGRIDVPYWDGTAQIVDGLTMLGFGQKVHHEPKGYFGGLSEDGRAIVRFDFQEEDSDGFPVPPEKLEKP